MRETLIQLGRWLNCLTGRHTIYYVGSFVKCEYCRYISIAPQVLGPIDLGRHIAEES